MGFDLKTAKPVGGFDLSTAKPVETPSGGWLKGAAETVGALGSGMVAGPVAGYAGLVGAAVPGKQGQGARWAEKVQDTLSYQPKTREGQAITGVISYPFEKLAQAADKAGGAVTDATGSPTTGVGANLAINSIPAAVGKILPKGMSAKAKAKQSANAARDAALTEAGNAGFVVTPTQGGKGLFKRTLEGLTGSAKAEKVASIKNQENANRLIRQDLNLPPNQHITVGTLDAIRKNAAEAYEAVKSSVKTIKPDNQFRKDLADLRGDYVNAAKDYPDLIRNDAIEGLIKALDTPASPRSMVELTRKLRKDAAGNLKAADAPDRQALGMAQRNAAAALEEMIDRALQSVGKGDLVKTWQAARQRIAKTYDVEAALNESTGDVSARHLGRMYDKGRPLTGGMEKVARFARQFEGSARDVGKMRDQTEFSFADGLVGGASGLAIGNWSGMAAAGVRPGVRRLLVGKAKAATYGPPAALRALMEAQRIAVPAEMAAGMED